MQLFGKPKYLRGKYTYGKLNVRFPMADLRVGRFCSIADNVTVFLGGNHNTSSISTFPFGHTEESKELSDPIPNHPTSKGHVIIGNDVWIGANSTIMSGITIGNGVVIAANSHVVTDIPDYAIFGGNPARLIRMRFPNEIIELLNEIQWWNFSTKRIKKIITLLTQEHVDIELITKLAREI